MVKINRIYTRTGDDGQTGLVDGSRVSKSSIRVQAFGDIDELNSWLGYVISLSSDPKLSEIIPILSIIQNELFDIGSELASPLGFDLKNLPLVEQQQVEQIEKWIDNFSGKLPELRSFILPGGAHVTSALHIARTVARRAERVVIELNQLEPIRPVTLRYINRLNDLLFSLARYSSHQLQQDEILWKPAATRKTS
jgi:cob(I)alamin adenosyltransferase